MMVFEYAPNGTLFEHLQIKEAEHLDWTSRMRIVMGIAYCLEYMHGMTPPIAFKNLNSKAVYLIEESFHFIFVLMFNAFILTYMFCFVIYDIFVLKSLQELFMGKVPAMLQYLGQLDPIPDDLLKEVDKQFVECAWGFKNGRITGLSNLSLEYNGGSAAHSVPSEVLTQLSNENSKLHE